MSAQLKNIAVLIDADNASAKNIGHILEEIKKLGHITCKKIYGDWGNAHIQSWQDALLKYAIDPMQHFAYVKGKNATDIGMVIEAMDLLYSNIYDGFCLISSDSDFTSLALRIRKNHVKVFGFGKRSTVSAFSQACDTFFYVEDLLTTPKMVESSINPPSSANKKITQSITKATNKPVEAWDEKRLKCDTKLLNSLRASIIDHPKADAQCWLNLGLVGKGMKEHYPDFDSKNYGYDSISALLRTIDLFEVRKTETTLSVRSKNSVNVSSRKAVEHQPSIKNKQHNTIECKSHTPLIIPSFLTNIIIEASNVIDVALFKIYAKGRVTNDDDLIFYGQTHDKNHTIELQQQNSPLIAMTRIECSLHKLSTEITQLMIVLSTNTHRISIDQKNQFVHVQIQNYCRNNGDGKGDILFESGFDISQKKGKGLKLFNLTRVNSGWNFSAINQDVKGGLREMCEQYGIEISDD